MAINKVEYGSNTLIDLTNDTVTADTMLEGATAHNAAGERIVGNVTIPTSLPANGGNADTVDGYHIVVSSTAPTVNDPNVITIVI